ADPRRSTETDPKRSCESRIYRPIFSSLPRSYIQANLIPSVLGAKGLPVLSGDSAKLPRSSLSAHRAKKTGADMADRPTDKYSAGEQGLGYIYQARLALLHLLQLSEDTAVFLEKDD